MRFLTVILAVCAVVVLGGPAAVAKEWKTLRLGVDATSPPFESVNPKGEIVGWEIDYGNALCEKMKLKCTWQNQDWDGIIPSLLANKFDVIFSGMNITETRKKKVIFSDAYYGPPPAFAAASSYSGTDVSPAALKDKTIGAQSSTTFANYLEKYYPGSRIKLYPGADDPQLDLASGRIDFVHNDLIVLEEFFQKAGKGCCRIVAAVKRDPAIHGPGSGAAFRPEDTDLRDMFNKAIKEADEDGTFKALAAKYFTVSIRGD
jgi:polar amino acid transport system substrate-binding protein